MQAVSSLLTEGYKPGMVDAVIGIDARGFIFAGAAAITLEAGFVPVRKKGKLPYQTLEQDYALEYGAASVAVHVDALKPGSRVLVIDDLLATGGTAAATAALLERLGATILEISFLIELSFLGGPQPAQTLPGPFPGGVLSLRIRSMPLPFDPGEDLPVYQPGRPIEEVARELGLPAQEMRKLASNENPLGPSPRAVAAMRRALANANLYPDGNACCRWGCRGFRRMPPRFCRAYSDRRPARNRCFARASGLFRPTIARSGQHPMNGLSQYPCSRCSAGLVQTGPG